MAGSGSADLRIELNGTPVLSPGYLEWHAKRIALTLDTLRRTGARRIVEVGADPWIMTSMLAEEPGLEVCATISAQEITQWPDDIGVTRRRYTLRGPSGAEHAFWNYSANVERRLFDLEETPDTVIASEIVEHLVRAPHVMFLNANRWLGVGGRLLVTTPNGCQFANPFRRATPTPAYRSHLYERHAYLYRLDDLAELVSLCGFRVLERGYWDPYPRRGLASIYGVLASIPAGYFREKFKKTIYVVAEKEKDIQRLARVPAVYDARGDWEHVDPLRERAG